MTGPPPDMGNDGILRPASKNGNSLCVWRDSVAFGLEGSFLQVSSNLRTTLKNYIC